MISLKSKTQLIRENETIKRTLQESEAQCLRREKIYCDFAQLLSGVLHIEAVLPDVLKLAVEACGADCGTLDVIAPSEELEFLPHSFELPPALLELRYRPAGENLSWGLEESGRAILLDNYPRQPDARPELAAAGLLSLMGSPLLDGKTSFGSLVVYGFQSESQFDNQSFERLIAISRIVGTTIHKDWLNRQVEVLSTSDPLTGLYNYRHFLDIAQHELNRIQRYGGCASVILLDIDHFKHINEAYGHPAGDEILQAVAAWCQKYLRHSDVLCRFGGEEFAFLLVETDIDQAYLTAERLRQQIAAAEVQTNRGALSLTVSLGVAGATCSELVDMERLLERASQVLFAAKAGGRNQTALWNPQEKNENSLER